MDKGGTWTKWIAKYSRCFTKDLVIHPREHDLVIGTFGRSIWVLDDIRPLRALAKNPAIKEKANASFLNRPQPIWQPISRPMEHVLVEMPYTMEPTREVVPCLAFLHNPKAVRVQIL